MGLTGLQIYQMLPKTNCNECECSTCLAFAMNLAARKIDLSTCPYLSEDVKAKLSAADEPPMRLVTIGAGERTLKVGGEKSMFRHEKRFENPPGFAMLLTDTMEGAEIDARLKSFREIQFERMGLLLRPELVAIRNDSGDVRKYADVVDRVNRESDAGIILMSEKAEALSAALEICADRKPLVYAATPDNFEQMAALVKKHSCALAVRASGLEELAGLTTKLAKGGIRDLVLDSGSRTLRPAFEDQVIIRKAAVQGNFRPFSFPTIVFPCEMTDDPMLEVLMGATFVAKYGGIIVFSDFRRETLFPLLLQRMDLYNDPEEPLMAPEGIHEIGKPDENSPVLLTSSWALSYFNLSLEAETAHTPAFLCVERIKEADSMCWCTHCLRSTQRGNFNADDTKKFIEGCGIADRVKHRKLVISGRSADAKAELETALPDWEIIVGPAEAAQVPGFLRGIEDRFLVAGHA